MINFDTYTYCVEYVIKDTFQKCIFINLQIIIFINNIYTI